MPGENGGVGSTIKARRAECRKDPEKTARCCKNDLRGVYINLGRETEVWKNKEPWRKKGGYVRGGLIHLTGNNSEGRLGKEGSYRKEKTTTKGLKRGSCDRGKSVNYL